MKIFKYTLFLFIISLLPLSVVVGRDMEPGSFQHKIVTGFNIGATAPVPIPAEVRSIDAWWPQFAPQLGYNIIYNVKSNWGIGSGILLDYKGMGVRDRVKYMYTSVVLEAEGNKPLVGYFVGRNETRVKSAYVTLPLYILYRPSTNWDLRIGGYAAYRYSSEFKGSVWDGYLRTPDPTGDKIVISKEDRATFNFGDDMRNFDFGLTIGAERTINNRFGIFGNFNWGLTSIFPSGFNAVSFDMYNIYMTLGLTYNL